MINSCCCKRSEVNSDGEEFEFAAEDKIDCQAMICSLQMQMPSYETPTQLPCGCHDNEKCPHHKC